MTSRVDRPGVVAGDRPRAIRVGAKDDAVCSAERILAKSEAAQIQWDAFVRKQPGNTSNRWPVQDLSAGTDPHWRSADPPDTAALNALRDTLRRTGLRAAPIPTLKV
jgi:hypothetical protein